MITSADYSRLLPMTGDPQMNSFYTFLALDLANERSREANQQRLAALAREGQPVRESSARRTVAVILAAFSRLSAGAVRRLDACVADDLADSFATSR
jgi:hypothetical protein